MTAQQAWSRARQQQRSGLRPRPRCPWSSDVWCLRTSVKVAPDGTIPLGSQRFKLSVPQANKLVSCQHPDGTYSVLADAPCKRPNPACSSATGLVHDPLKPDHA